LNSSTNKKPQNNRYEVKLVMVLDFLINHPAKAKALDEKARRLVLENYTWEKNADQMIKVYDEAINGN
jgi:teichuronic acid biosynthesis glycosyltransferase TuaC